MPGPPRRLAHRGFGKRSQAALAGEAHEDDIQHRHRKAVVVEHVLRHVAQPMRGPGRRLAEDQDLAAPGFEQAEDEAEQGGLAAAVGADDADHLPLVNLPGSHP